MDVAFGDISRNDTEAVSYTHLDVYKRQGVYNALSSRGHWDSVHDTFPKHAITSGVTPWKINDGWLNHFQFPAEMKGITPLVWSGKEKLGAPEGGDKDVVAWTYNRPSGGRSFSFSGLDAHHAWEQAGMRQLVINGVLWSCLLYTSRCV